MRRIFTMDNNGMYTGNNQQQGMPQGAPQQQYPMPLMEEPMTVKEWIITFLLLLIPCANIILVFIWAFGNGEKKSKSNFFKAYLIMALIVIALYVIIMLIFGASILASLASLPSSLY